MGDKNIGPCHLSTVSGSSNSPDKLSQTVSSLWLIAVNLKDSFEYFRLWPYRFWILPLTPLSDCGQWFCEWWPVEKQQPSGFPELSRETNGSQTLVSSKKSWGLSYRVNIPWGLNLPSTTKTLHNKGSTWGKELYLLFPPTPTEHPSVSFFHPKKILMSPLG